MTFIPTRPWRWSRQSVLKRWHIKFRCWGITQKKEYNKLWTVVTSHASDMTSPLVGFTVLWLSDYAMYVSVLFKYLLNCHYLCVTLMWWSLCRCIFKGLAVEESWLLKMGLISVPKTCTSLHWVKSQDNADLICTMTETWNNTGAMFFTECPNPQKVIAY